jgi:hypothetical protein
MVDELTPTEAPALFMEIWRDLRMKRRTCASLVTRSHEREACKARGVSKSMDGRVTTLYVQGKQRTLNFEFFTKRSGGPSKNRTCNNPLGKDRYIHLTMGPFDGG